ncbi:hypothetical protein ACHAPF_008233, partial [Botrytis cinerea]
NSTEITGSRMISPARKVIAPVSKSKAAGAWQIVAFFYAYRISIDAFGVEKNPIASKIRGSIVDGSCTLDEFAELTRKPNKNNIPFPKGLIGNSLTPDPLTTVQRIENSAYDSSQLFDHEKLLPGQFDNMRSGNLPSFADQIQKLNNHVAAARISMTNEMGLDQNFFDTEPNFTNLKTAIHGISDARRADTNLHILGELFENLAKEGIKPVFKTVVALDLTTYLDIDTAMTISGSTNSVFDAKTAVDRVLAEIGALSKEKVNRNHAAIISRLDQWKSDLNAPC